MSKSMKTFEGELTNNRKAAKVVWLRVDIYHKWLYENYPSKQQRPKKFGYSKKEFAESWQKILYNLKLAHQASSSKLHVPNQLNTSKQVLGKKHWNRGWCPT